VTVDLYVELRTVVQALNGDGLDYAVCGGIALALHGFPRFTKDIDLLVQPDDLDRIIDIAERCGFLESSGRIPFEQCDVYRVSKVEGANYLVLDLILVSLALEEVWHSRTDYDWQGERLRIVSAEGLAKMKRMAGRDQDLVDLRRMGFSDDDEETNATE
jgi:hypothetical protein